MATNDLVTKTLIGAGVIHMEHYVICGDRYLGITKQLALSLEQFPEIDRFCKSKEELS